MENGGRTGMPVENGGRKCIRNLILKRRAGLVLSDTLSTPIGVQENGGEIEANMGIILVQNGDNFRKTSSESAGAAASGDWQQDSQALSLRRSTVGQSGDE